MVDRIEFNEARVSAADLAGGARMGLESKAIGFIRGLLGGLVKSDQQAKRVVFVFVLLLLLVSVYYFLQSFGSSDTKEVLKSIHA